MTKYPDSIQKAIEAFAKLPGIGTKTAERLVMFFVRKNEDERKTFIQALQHVHDGISICEECGFMTEDAHKKCRYCRDSKRNRHQICVVPDAQTLQVIEKSGAYSGVYHVLGGQINPLEGISADSLSIRQLVRRIKEHQDVKEIILATGTDIEGEQTALYLIKTLRGMQITVSRLARGIPRGSNLEYTDEVTLADAIKDRKQI